MKTNLIQYFQATVARCPDRVAVWDAGRDYSFRESFVRSQALANEIHRISSMTRRIGEILKTMKSLLEITDEAHRKDVTQTVVRLAA